MGSHDSQRIERILKGGTGVAPPRVLLVEDDPDLRAVLLDDLARGGAEVIEASDGLDALARMRESHPDVVVFDLMMPRMDGWQFRVEQRRDPELARTPVVAMSASGASSARAVDADAYLTKPIRAGMLGRAIGDVLIARARRDELERAAHRERLAALGTLAAGLAHEINNPLTYVIMNLVAAQQSLATIADPAQRDHVGRLIAVALEGSERIAGVVRSVRILAREDTQSQGPLDVRSPLESALTIIGNDLRRRAVLVKDLGESPFVIGDEGQLGQVFLNLLANAVDAIPEGEPDQHQVRVTTGTDEAGRALIEIADTGAGIPEHLLDHVFEPFFTTKPVGKGTGLGLSISAGIIGALGGTISVTSQVDHGTTFRVVLPAGAGRR
jgi:signal transduction histidine kinase